MIVASISVNNVFPKSFIVVFNSFPNTIDSAKPLEKPFIPLSKNTLTCFAISFKSFNGSFIDVETLSKLLFTSTRLLFVFLSSSLINIILSL